MNEWMKKWSGDNEGIGHELSKRGPGRKSSTAKIWSVQKVQIRLQQFWIRVLNPEN